MLEFFDIFLKSMPKASEDLSTLDNNHNKNPLICNSSIFSSWGKREIDKFRPTIKKTTMRISCANTGRYVVRARCVSLHTSNSYINYQWRKPLYFFTYILSTHTYILYRTITTLRLNRNMLLLFSTHGSIERVN